MKRFIIYESESVTHISLLEQILSNNSIKKFTELNNFSDRKKYANDHFKMIGEGTGRYVYDINNEFVLKLAKNNKGVEQNKTEINISENNKYNDVIAKIFDYDKSGIYVIQQKANKITKQSFKKITGIDLNIFFYYLKYDKKIDGEKSEFFNKIDSLIKKFDLERYDLTNKNAWGIINDNIVLIDYGLDMNTARKLYGVEY